MSPCRGKSIDHVMLLSLQACLISFQSVTFVIFYIYFVFLMNRISDFLCTFAQNLRKVAEMSR